MTQAFKHVLVPVDFSDESELAAEVAIEKFGEEADTITIVTICESRSNRHAEMPPEIDDMVVEGVQHKTKVFVDKFKDKHKNLKSVIKKGHASQQILNAAKDLDVDLIVMGSQGRSSLARVFFGSTTYDVARKAHCSVFAIRT